MYKLQFGDTFLDQLLGFTKNFHSKNIELIVDSGLENEKQIVDNYILLSRSLRNQISLAVQEYFQQDVIAKNTGGENIFSVIHIQRLRLFVYFSEDSKNKIRYIESVEFFRK